MSEENALLKKFSEMMKEHDIKIALPGTGGRMFLHGETRERLINMFDITTGIVQPSGKSTVSEELALMAQQRGLTIVQQKSRGLNLESKIDVKFDFTKFKLDTDNQSSAENITNEDKQP